MVTHAAWIAYPRHVFNETKVSGIQTSDVSSTRYHTPPPDRISPPYFLEKYPACQYVNGPTQAYRKLTVFPPRNVQEGAVLKPLGIRDFMQTSFAPQAHSSPALISRGRPRRLLRPTVHSQLRVRSFLSTVE